MPGAEPSSSNSLITIDVPTCAGHKSSNSVCPYISSSILSFISSPILTPEKSYGSRVATLSPKSSVWADGNGSVVTVTTPV